MEKNIKRIVIAGGGTGGHIFPALAIANALLVHAPGIEILFIGAKGKMEMEKVPAAGFNIRGLDIAGFNRSSILKNIGLPWKLIKSFLQVKNIFKDFNPDAAIGVGGYSSFPVLKYAQQQGLKTFIHESNSFAGKSNISIGRRATKIFTATEGMEKFFPAEKIMVSGNPVRKSILEGVVSKEDALKAFDLDPYKTTVLSVGGSLGAQSINEAIASHINDFEKNNIQLIWQTGKPYMERAGQAAAGKPNVWTGDFISRMDLAYSAADVVISRSGAMATAELCIVKKPVVFVPYPFAAEDHQTANAKVIVQKDAALMIENSKASQNLVPVVINLAKDSVRRNKLAENIGKLAIKDADDVIAEEILKALN